jgi:Protein of unknown function (DUF3107)
VEVRIGVTQSIKEIEVELDDVERDKTLAEISATVGTGEGVLWLTDKRGRTVGVPVPKVAYIEVGSPAEERRVGFAR